MVGLNLVLKKRYLSFDLYRQLRLEIRELYVLTVELNQKFSVRSGPDSDSSILSAWENVISVDVQRGDRASMGVCHLPYYSSSLLVEASDKSISPASHDWIVVKSDAAGWSTVHLTGGSCENGFVLWKIPNFSCAILIYRQELVWPLWGEMEIVNWACMGIGMEQEREVSFKDSIELATNGSREELFLVIGDSQRHDLWIQLGFVS